MNKPTIEDLLKSLQGNNNSSSNLANTKDTWERIGKKDSFSELGLTSSELDTFLSDWISSNPYENIA